MRAFWVFCAILTLIPTIAWAENVTAKASKSATSVSKSKQYAAKNKANPQKAATSKKSKAATKAATNKKLKKSKAVSKASTSKTKKYLAKSKTKSQKVAVKAKARKHYAKAAKRNNKSRLKKAVLRKQENWVGRRLSLHSSAALVLDQSTGRVLFTKNIETKVPIASITKVMTAMVILDSRLPLDELITITDDDVDRLRYSSSRLRVGATLTRRELLHLALMASENRAAAALGRTYPGGITIFVEAMNRKAQALGMWNTFFADSSGLRTENMSTATDLAKMVAGAHEYPLIRELTTTSSYIVNSPARKARKVAFHNTNGLVRSKKWDIGLSKTGYIREAGHCLVMQAQIANRSVVIVLLDSWGKYSRIGDANRIKSWLESNKDTLLADTGAEAPLAH